MAASISYKIGGKFDSKPLDQANNGIKKITGQVKALNAMVGGMVIAKVMQGINKVVSGSTEAFMSQNKAATLANKAFQNNAQLTSKSITNIKSAMNNFSLNNLIDGDTLNNAAALASQMGLNEEQIIKVMDAASEMASAGIMPMDQAVKALSQSYSGNVAQLKRLNPELANLTAEQLKAGAAVDAMKKKYDGFRETLSGTFEGRNTQIKNQFSDLQASVGGIIQALKFEGQGKLLPKLQEITSFIEGHRDQIINFFLNLPEIAQVGLKGCKEIISRFFDTLPDFGQFMFGTITNWLPVVQSFFLAAKDVIIGVLDVTFGNIARLFYNKVIIPIKKQIQDSVNEFVSAHPKIAEFLHLDKIQFDFTEKSYSNFSGYMDSATQNVNNAIAQAKDSAKKQKELNDSYFSNFTDITDEMTADLSKILNKDLPAELKKAFQGAAGGTTATLSSSGSSSDSTGTNVLGTVQNQVNSFLSGLGQIGQAFSSVRTIVSSLTSGLSSAAGWIGLIVQFLSALNSSMSSASENYSNVVNLFSTISNVVAKIISSNVDEMLKPFADGLEKIGTIIGTIFNAIFKAGNDAFTSFFSALTNVLDAVMQIVQALAPLITMILELLHVISGAQLVMSILTYAINIFANFIKKIAEGIAYVVEHVANFFIALYNAIVSIFKKISLPTGIRIGRSGIHIKWKSLATMMGMEKKDAISIDLGDDDDTSTSSSSSSSVSGGSASYTAAKDVYVNIYFNNSFVNGDAQEIAIMLKKEIARAESKNLV